MHTNTIFLSCSIGYLLPFMYILSTLYIIDSYGFKINIYYKKEHNKYIISNIRYHNKLVIFTLLTWYHNKLQIVSMNQKTPLK